MKSPKRLFLGATVVAGVLSLGASANAETRLLDQGRLLLTGGVTNVEGASGGGIATWATITGYGDNDGIGANVHGTYVNVKNYALSDYGASVGLYNRVELSYARQDFDTQKIGAELGLGKNYNFNQDIYGAKVRLIGDLVYDQEGLSL